MEKSLYQMSNDSKSIPLRVSFQVLTKNNPYPIPIEKKKKKDNPTFATAMKKRKNSVDLKITPLLLFSPA